MAHYPTGQNSPLELMFAKFGTTKIAKNLEVFCSHFEGCGVFQYFVFTIANLQTSRKLGYPQTLTILTSHPGNCTAVHSKQLMQISTVVPPFSYSVFSHYDKAASHPQLRNIE